MAAQGTANATTIHTSCKGSSSLEESEESLVSGEEDLVSRMEFVSAWKGRP